jgi:hypothetical protein
MDHRAVCVNWSAAGGEHDRCWGDCVGQCRRASPIPGLSESSSRDVRVDQYHQGSSTTGARVKGFCGNPARGSSTRVAASPTRSTVDARTSELQMRTTPPLGLRWSPRSVRSASPKKIRRQIDRDAELIDADTFASVEWHFFASATSNRIAYDPVLFEYLTEKGIPYVIHLP